jgi:hypothetical protein
MVAVTYSPCLELSWQHGGEVVCSTDRISLSREDGGFFHCTLSTAVIEDEVTYKPTPTFVL